MASNAAAEQNIKDRASIVFHSLSNHDKAEPESGFELEPEFEASTIRRKNDLIEQLTKTLEQKSAQVHMSINSRMLNPANPNIDFMQLLGLITPNSGLTRLSCWRARQLPACPRGGARARARATADPRHTKLIQKKQH